MPQSKAKTRKRTQKQRQAFSSTAIVQSFSDPRTSTRISWDHSLVPPFTRRKLVYSQTVTLTTGSAGVLGTPQQFSINSLFDPDTTGVGHQPYGFDQFKAFYGSYRVDRCTVKLICTNIGASSDLQFGVYFFSIGGFNSISGITLDAATERPDVSTWLLSPSGHNRNSSFKAVVNCATFVGRPPREYEADPQYQAVNTASPATNLGFQLAVGSPAGTGSITSIVQATIEYDAFFFGRVTLSGS